MQADPGAEPATRGSEPFVLFELAGATYGVRSRDIQQLDMVGSITPVPNAPEFVDGVVSVRGQVIPAINLRRRFGFPRAPMDLRTRLLVVRTAGRTVGLVVDTAREFATIDAASIQPPPDAVTGMSGRYLEGLAHLGDRLVLVLDVAELVDPEPKDPSPDLMNAAEE